MSEITDKIKTVDELHAIYCLMCSARALRREAEETEDRALTYGMEKLENEAITRIEDLQDKLHPETPI